MNYPKLSTAIDWYVESILPTKSQSHEKMQTSQLHHWKSQLGHLRLNEVTPKMVNDNLPARGPATCNRYLSAISSVLKQDGIIIKFSRYREPRGRVRFLNDDERSRLLDACRKSRSKVLYPMVILALSRGMRKSEILRLTWSQVDLQRGLIYLVDTKNHEPRMIPVGGHALDLISRLPHKSKYVFLTRTGEYRRHLADCWYPTLRKANIQDFTFHDLRHTAASYHWHRHVRGDRVLRTIHL
jgi:integrase